MVWSLQTASETRREATERENHTLAVLYATSQVLSSANESETGQRGFLLTRDERFLVPYYHGRVTLSRGIERLRKYTRDNASQRARLDRL